MRESQAKGERKAMFKFVMLASISVWTLWLSRYYVQDEQFERVLRNTVVSVREAHAGHVDFAVHGRLSGFLGMRVPIF